MLVGDCEQSIETTLVCDGDGFVGTVQVTACYAEGPAAVTARFVSPDMIAGTISFSATEDYYNTGRLNAVFTLERP